jgi:D-arabinose 1-dehydrogenase-like Zn-dependent alcohol dehydrogenase
VGERVLVQTDYRHLATASSNAAFGYNFEGALQEYVIVDERVALDPATGERFLIPVSENLPRAAVALVEPWACVEAAYAWPERGAPSPGGRLAIVGDPGTRLAGLPAFLADARPAEVQWVAQPGAPLQSAMGDAVAHLGSHRRVESVDALDGPFDDIVYAGASAEVIETLGAKLGFRGVMAVVLAGRRVERDVSLDVGRIHYDLTRYIGTAGSDVREAYARVPAVTEVRPGDRVAIIGAAGPMGLMHTVRTAVLDMAGIRIDAADVDDARLEHLAHVAGPLAQAGGVELRVVNTRRDPLVGPYGYVAVMVPMPALVAQAVTLAGDGGIVNAFAGFAVGTCAEVDMNAIAGRGVYIVGTSGSRIQDMKAVLAKCESGRLDTTVSLDAVAGLAGVPAALAAIDGRTSGGKIMIYPAAGDLPLTRLGDLEGVRPGAAAAMAEGRWTKDAETALLQGI